MEARRLARADLASQIAIHVDWLAPLLEATVWRPPHPIRERLQQTLGVDLGSLYDKESGPRLLEPRILLKYRVLDIEEAWADLSLAEIHGAAPDNRFQDGRVGELRPREVLFFDRIRPLASQASKAAGRDFSPADLLTLTYVRVVTADSFCSSVPGLDGWLSVILSHVIASERRRIYRQSTVRSSLALRSRVAQLRDTGRLSTLEAAAALLCKSSGLKREIAVEHFAYALGLPARGLASSLDLLGRYPPRTQPASLYQAAGDEEDGGDLAQTVAAEGPTPEEVAACQAELEHVSRAVATMSQGYRREAVLYSLLVAKGGPLTNRDLGYALNVNPKKVSGNWGGQALKRFQKALQEAAR